MMNLEVIFSFILIANQLIDIPLKMSSYLALFLFACWLKKQNSYGQKQKRLGAKILEKQPIDQKKINVVQQIQPDVAKQVANNLSGEFREISGGWSITFNPIPEFPVIYAVTSKEVQMSYNENKSKEMPGVIYAFKWLYLNAIIREARKLDSNLPQISFSGLI